MKQQKTSIKKKKKTGPLKDNNTSFVMEFFLIMKKRVDTIHDMKMSSKHIRRSKLQKV